jgi:hypothetical protein
LDFREVGSDLLHVEKCRSTVAPQVGLSAAKPNLQASMSGFAALSPTCDLGFPPSGACVDFASAPS